MATSMNVKNLPSLAASPSYEAWEKAIDYWQIITDIPPEKKVLQLYCHYLEKREKQYLSSM